MQVTFDPNSNVHPATVVPRWLAVKDGAGEILLLHRDRIRNSSCSFMGSEELSLQVSL